MLLCPDDGDLSPEPASGPAAAPAHQGVLRQGDRQLQLHHPRPPGPGPAARGEERQEGRPHQEAGRGHPPQPRPQRAPGGPDPLLRHREAFRQEDRLRHGDTHQLPGEAEIVAVGAEPQDPGS